MSRFIMAVLVFCCFNAAAAFAQQEPKRIQPAGSAAKPIDKNPIDKNTVPETPLVDVPIEQLGKQFRLLGKLKLPLGEVARVQGLIVAGTGKGDDDGVNVRVFRINGVVTQEFIQIKLTDHYGRDEVPVQPGTTCELEGFETGGFIGVPAEAVKRAGGVSQTTTSQNTTHRFLHEFTVMQATEVKFEHFTPADFLGREMLVQGQATSDGGSAYIVGNKWKLLVDNGTPWPKHTEGKTVEARGVIRTIGKSTTYRLENGGKNNNSRLVHLADQVGKSVTLRGTFGTAKGEPYFRYRGEGLQVDGLKELIAQAGLDLNQHAQLTGSLEARQVTSQYPNGSTETRTAYTVRRATLKPTDPLLGIERAEPTDGGVAKAMSNDIR